MSSFIPSGRLSAINHGDSKIEIQTEFSKHPEPRIATSVSIKGRVIHKIQKQWGKTIDSLDEMREVEEVINRQHDEVTVLVHEHAGTLVEHSQKAPEPAMPQSIIEQVERLPAIQSAFILTADGQVLTRHKVTREAEIMAAFIGALTDVLFDLAKSTNLGECEDCVLSLGTHDLLLLPYQGGYLAALTDPKVKKKEILTELWKIASAA
jgi:hypothetical protein